MGMTPGKISWFGGPQDHSAGPTTASGASVAVPGMAVYNHATLGGYWLVKMPNGRSAVLKQTDFGPAPSTGRKYDFTYSALPHLGYSTGNFPTNATASAQYLGKSVPGQYRHLVIGQGGTAVAGAQPSGGKGHGKGGGTQIVNDKIQGIKTSFTSGGIDWGAAGAAAMMQAADQPINTTGTATFHADHLLSSLMSAASTGQYMNPRVPNSMMTQQNVKSRVPAKGGGVRNNLGNVSAHGYVNPIPGASLGRTDMGVDATMHSGAAIRAMGNSKVIGISPNWYAGQPYVLFQLLDGPLKGHYYYIAEAINPHVHAGQVVRAGQTVGTFNSGGTGLELGWGTSTPGRAAAASIYHEGMVTPQGTNFRGVLTHLH